MLLEALSIRNYRSLEDVSLEGFQKFNVLIGRNNCGKSSVFGALSLLGSFIWGQGVDWESVLTDKNKQLPLEIGLVFSLSPPDREDLISKVCSHKHWKQRINDVESSSFCRKISYLFRSPPGHPSLLHLREVKCLAEDNSWFVWQAAVGDEKSGNTASDFISWASIHQHVPPQALVLPAIERRQRATHNLSFGSEVEGADVNRWPMRALAQFLHKAYFFNPFRHSTAVLPVRGGDVLGQNGSNLAQVLHSIHNDNRPKFYLIERFILGALPDIGYLQTPVLPNSNNTEISFRNSNKDFAVRLHDMGGGIEQLLMAATVLLTTKNDSPLFLEEPESHLHAGAQRYLIEKLYEDGRQVFVTTHSPTFINVPRAKSVHQLTMKSGRTSATKIDIESASEVLADIGVRNSDMLFSDAVVFVEGSGDKDVLSAWSNTLGINLAENNISVLVMDGGDFSNRRVRLRKEVLEGIAGKTTVPHLFLFDRDERPEKEIEELQSAFGKTVYFFQKRELENYMLLPEALLAAIKAKLISTKQPVEKVDSIKPAEIAQFISLEANELYGLVLLKRIRAALLASPTGGIFPRDMVKKLAPKAHDPKLDLLLQRTLKTRSEQLQRDLNIRKVVATEQKKLQKEWKKPTNHLLLAPGSEIVEAVFSMLGLKYSKPADTKLIASKMTAAQIPHEINALIKRIHDLPANVHQKC
jgi:hypothetical protein